MGLHGFNGFCGVSVLPHSSWPLSPRQMGDKPPRTGQEGMARWGRGLTTQASSGGAALGSPGACCKQPVNPGDLQESGTLPGPVGGGAQRHPGACAKATPPGCPAGCLCQVGWAGR